MTNNNEMLPSVKESAFISKARHLQSIHIREQIESRCRQNRKQIF